MDLDATFVRAHLQTRRLLGTRRVIDVRRQGGRSACALAVLDDGTALFLKRARRRGARDVLADEARILRWTSPALCAALRDYSSNEGVLVCEGLMGYRALDADLAGKKLPGTGALRLCAERLASCHSLSWPPAAGPAVIPRAPLFDWSALTPSDLASQPDGFTDLAERVHAAPGLLDAARALRAGWRTECFVHGDMKLDNAMYRRPERGQAADVRIIDWETGGIGDPAHDVGGVVGDLLHHWLSSIDIARGTTVDEWVASARVPFTALKVATRAFWLAYARRRRGVERSRVLAYAGEFLLDRALATVLVHGVVSGRAVCLLHVARTLMRGAPLMAEQLLPREKR